MDDERNKKKQGECKIKRKDEFAVSDHMSIFYISKITSSL